MKLILKYPSFFASDSFWVYLFWKSPKFVDNRIFGKFFNWLDFAKRNKGNDSCFSNSSRKQLLIETLNEKLRLVVPGIYIVQLMKIPKINWFCFRFFGPSKWNCIKLKHSIFYSVFSFKIKELLIEAGMQKMKPVNRVKYELVFRDKKQYSVDFVKICWVCKYSVIIGWILVKKSPTFPKANFCGAYFAGQNTSSSYGD